MTLVRLPGDVAPWDWELLSSNGSELRLAAGNDLTYHHTLELVFTDVAYLACPARFSHPRFREPTPAERDLVRRYVGGDPPVLIAFDIEAMMGEGDLPGLIAAESVEAVPGLVYRYWRDGLKPGERLAPFVRRRSGPPDLPSRRPGQAGRGQVGSGALSAP